MQAAIALALDITIAIRRRRSPGSTVSTAPTPRMSKKPCASLALSLPIVARL